ncbi:hypothetical protein D3C73_1383730 [compost metagenome]
MRMSRFLPVLAEPLPNMLHKRGRITQSTLLIKRKAAHMSAGVVGCQEAAVR